MPRVLFTALFYYSVNTCLCQHTSGTCGREGHPNLLGRRIVGGKEASKGEFPWQVRLRVFGSTFCSGVLIDRHWVLTSARCFKGQYDARNWNVILGDYDRQSVDGTELWVHAANVVIHGDFTQDPYTNDVAMVQLKPYAASKVYAPLCLPDSNTDLSGSQCYLTGWGAANKGKDFAEKLQKLPMNIMSQCALPAKSSRDYVCAAGEPSDGGPCIGDIGASLQCNDGHDWLAAGIAFDMFSCDNTTTPHVFTNVISYLPWIRKTMHLLG